MGQPLLTLIHEYSAPLTSKLTSARVLWVGSFNQTTFPQKDGKTFNETPTQFYT